MNGQPIAQAAPERDAGPGKAGSAVPGYAWVILGVVFLASVAAPLNQFKVPPVMPVMMETFQLSIASAGMLMSVFAITGFLLALPAGIIVQRFGLKTTGIVAVSCMVVGSILGALSNSAGLMLFSRVVEGIGMGLIAVVAPASIATWFPPDRQGAPMGIWATWVPVGSVLMYLLAPALEAALGWQSIWWFGAGFALLALVLFAIFMKMPVAGPQSAGGESAGRGAPKLGQALSNRNIWLLGLEFACFNLALLAINTYYPTFLSGERGYSMAAASSTTSLIMIVTIFSAPLAGMLSDRIRSRRLVFSLPYIVVAVMMLFPFNVSGMMISAWLILLGVVSGAIPTATFAAAPEVMGRPELAGMGMAVVTLGQNLGMFIGPLIFGALIESAGWTTAGYSMIPAMVLGLVAGWLVKVR